VACRQVEALRTGSLLSGCICAGGCSRGGCHTKTLRTLLLTISSRCRRGSSRAKARRAKRLGLRGKQGLRVDETARRREKPGWRRTSEAEALSDLEGEAGCVRRNTPPKSVPFRFRHTWEGWAPAPQPELSQGPGKQNVSSGEEGTNGETRPTFLRAADFATNLCLVRHSKQCATRRKESIRGRKPRVGGSRPQHLHLHPPGAPPHQAKAARDISALGRKGAARGRGWHSHRCNAPPGDPPART
jgi:hypothetical protein